MSTQDSGSRRLPSGIGLWGGFLDRLPTTEALAAVRDVEQAGIGTVWLPEFSGVDPFLRAALYLGATESLTVAFGVATIHARDAEAMVAVASTLQEAFPGRIAFGLGVSHRHLAEARGGTYRGPLDAMRNYLTAMTATAGGRQLPPLFLGALGPKMIELAAAAPAGIHTYFCPVAHTRAARAAVGSGPWLAPSQMVAIDAGGRKWRDRARGYLGMCLGMPNYRSNLLRLGFSEDALATQSDELVDALVVADRPSALRERIHQHRDAGADHIVVQLVPPPAAAIVLERVARGVA